MSGKKIYMSSFYVPKVFYQSFFFEFEGFSRRGVRGRLYAMVKTFSISLTFLSAQLCMVDTHLQLVHAILYF